jgi:hypothetical protein
MNCIEPCSKWSGSLSTPPQLAVVAKNRCTSLTSAPGRGNGAWAKLASRSEPALPLARMRAGGDLVEIDAQRLSFTEQGADLLQREASRNRSVSARLRISNLHSALAIYLMPRRLN